MRARSSLYPLIFEPIYKHKVWGGRALEKLGRALPEQANIGVGESWELADLATTSVSGGGGNAEHSIVANGPLKGLSIRELMEQYGGALIGKGVQPANDGGFPLLIKFLDAKKNLSVQVHPSPDYAATHADAHLKSEAWYIIDHEPGAVIYKGLAPGVTPEQLSAALETNTDEAVVPLLNAIEVQKGDCHYLPSGTLHALGAGVLVAEVQTPSDTTYRVYDWGRTDRELHIEQAMACIDFDDDAQETGRTNRIPLIKGLSLTVVAACEYFSITEFACDTDIELAPQDSLGSTLAEQARIVIPLTGHLQLTHTQTPVEQTCLEPGQTALLPASVLPRRSKLQAKNGSRWLEIVPSDPAR